MSGLALGAFIFGNLIDRRGRPLRIYAFLEAGIAIYAIIIPLLFEQAQSAYLWLDRILGLPLFALSFLHFVLIFSILLVPTTLMGATLPVVVKFFVERMDGVGRRVGELYAVNTFGAVLGSAAAGFFLLPAVGARTTIFLAAATNLLLAFWSLLADRVIPNALGRVPVTTQRTPSTMEPHAQTTTRVFVGLILICTAFSGAASMIYQIAWTRALRLVIGSSIYAFSTMLTTFLVGLALGSFIFARFCGRRPASPWLFGWVQTAIGLTALALVPVFAWMPDLVLKIITQTTPSVSGALLSQFSLSFLAMIVPATLIGAAFPLAVQICARALAHVGRDVGFVYSASSVGTIAGALLGGFVLLPWLGAQISMMSAAAINGAIGILLLTVSTFRQPPWRRALPFAIALLFAAIIVALPRWNEKIMAGGVSVYIQDYIFAKNPAALFRESAASRQLLYYREGVHATVAVERTDRHLALKVDGKVDASNGTDMATQLMLGHLPLLFHPHPERVLVIGLGSGVTAGAASLHSEVRQIEVVELEPAVAEAANFFVEENRAVLRDPRVRLVIADGRNHILASPKRYDVISSEPSNPWMAGVSNLFSLEFYRLAEKRLADGGIMIQWVHSYNLFPNDLKMIVNTFRQVFPHSTLWRTVHGDYLIVGGRSPLIVDYKLLAKKIAGSEKIREDLARLRLNSPLDLMTLFYLDEHDLAAYAAGAPVNTDDRPLLEFSAPLALYTDTVELNAKLLREKRTAEFPPVANLPADLLAARRFHFAQLYWAVGEKEDALKQLAKAPTAARRDVSAGLARVKLLLALGELARANAELDELARLQPQNRTITSYLTAARTLRQLRAEEGLLRHARSRYGFPNPAEALNNVALLYIRLGIKSGEPALFELAANSLEESRRLEPQSYAVLNNLANAYFELGRFDEAAAAYAEIIRVMPQRPQPRFNLALVYERQGKFDSAYREYGMALVLKPDWSLPKDRLERLRKKAPVPREVDHSIKTRH
jgi:spermidine synthase